MLFYSIDQVRHRGEYGSCEVVVFRLKQTSVSGTDALVHALMRQNERHQSRRPHFHWASTSHLPSFAC